MPFGTHAKCSVEDNIFKRMSKEDKLVLDKLVPMDVKVSSPLATSSVGLDHSDNWLFSVVTAMTSVIPGQ